ncbi:tetratricopeptide repeat protein [Frateuria defendens]|uniref:tetratricopeptide repeat protein n=1 Tax=Frateuria defendens TaxID=2219559 RepID=UPI00066FCA95|nr:tetratricopeptide repeat protein [Frateuria defendens]
MTPRTALRLAAPFLLAAVLAACVPPAPPVPTRPSRPSYDLVAAIRTAGDHEKSVIDVNPLRDPGVAGLQDAAQADERAGRYADAAARLDQAIKLSPDSPDLLQDRAEIAVRLKDYGSAEKLAHRSWELGPKLGPLCARNWQTIVEMRLEADDAAGAASARKWVAQCHKEGVPRY